MSLNKRLEMLESKNYKPDLLNSIQWTEEEKQFRDDIHGRMEKIGATFYYEVCNDEEFERVKKLSTKACLIWYQNHLENNEPE